MGTQRPDLQTDRHRSCGGELSGAVAVGQAGRGGQSSIGLTSGKFRQEASEGSLLLLVAG